MEVIRILELVWNSTNIAHIWERHYVTRTEVEEVAYGYPQLLKVEQTYAGRFLVTDPKADGTLLVLILAPRGPGRFYPVTAYPADNKDRREYEQWKAGNNNE